MATANQGPFEGVAYGDPVMDPRDDIQVIDPFDDGEDRGGSGKKSKKDRNDDKDSGKPARTIYEGYVFERLKPVSGESLSWRRCGRRSLLITQDELIGLVKKHRSANRIKSAELDFKRLSADKQGIVNRIIEEKKLYEKSKTAEWTLVDVQTLAKRTGALSKELHKVQIVIKRTDKGNDKNGYAAMRSYAYPMEDIIDLSVPLERRKDKKDKNKRKSNQNDWNDPLHDPINMGAFDANDLHNNDNNHQDQQYQGQQYQDQQYHDQQPHWDPNVPDHAAPPQPPMPPGWQQQPNPFDAQQYGQNPNYLGGQGPLQDPNPFHPRGALPGQYDDPMSPREFIHPHHNGARVRERTRSADRDRIRSRSRSRSRRRQSLARRPSQRRRDDSVEDITNKVHRMYHHSDRDSSSSNYDDGRSFWSQDDERNRRYDRSPDTSVYSDDYPPRRSSKNYHRDGPPRPRYRSRHYHDADVQPEYTTYGRPYDHGRDRRYSSRDRRPPPITYDNRDRFADDYPSARGAEPRYLPAPPPPITRRNTDGFFPDRRQEYFDQRDRDREWGGGDWRRQSGQQAMREQNAFEAGRREEARRQQGRWL